MREENTQNTKYNLDNFNKVKLDKTCYNCKNLKGLVNWYCGKKEAIEARGTHFPDAKDCSFWEFEKF